ncbi:MAG: 16S rRNA (uracil(1498)-N(3))-methyltransferase [Verrucomicrobiota bacterium]
MHRFYLEPGSWNGQTLTLDAEESHHATSVLRLGPGEKVVVFDGEGREATTEITSAQKQEVQVQVLQEQKTFGYPASLVLAQAIPKGKNMDLIVQKATELGAAVVGPVLTERTVVRLDPGEARSKQEKWQRTAIEACKQCGQNWVPQIREPKSLEGVLAETGDCDLKLIASLQSDARPFFEILAEHQEMHEVRPKKVLVLIGPEGDYSPAEINLAKGSGCLPLSLGPIILRTETAALYSLSVLAYELMR